MFNTGLLWRKRRLLNPFRDDGLLFWIPRASFCWTRLVLSYLCSFTVSSGWTVLLVGLHYKELHSRTSIHLCRYSRLQWFTLGEVTCSGTTWSWQCWETIYIWLFFSCTKDRNSPRLVQVVLIQQHLYYITWVVKLLFSFSLCIQLYTKKCFSKWTKKSNRCTLFASCCYTKTVYV